MRTKSPASFVAWAALALGPLHAQAQNAPADPAPAAPAPPAAAPAPAPAPTPTVPTGTPGPAGETSIPPEAMPPNAPAERKPVLEIEGLTVQPNGLTSQETARRALAAGSTVAEKRAQLDVANARIEQTTIQFFPRVTLSASYTFVPNIANAAFGEGALVGASAPGPIGVIDNPDGPGQIPVDSAGRQLGAQNVAFEYPENNYAFTAQASIPISDYLLRLSDASAGAAASSDAARFALEAEERKVRTDARVLYYNWLRAQAQLFIANRAVERTRARLEDARAAFAVGRLSNADVLRLTAVVSNAELAATQAQAGALLGGAHLAIVMADRGGGIYQVGEGVPDVSTLPPPSSDPEAVRKLLREAQARRLEFKAIDAQIKALEYGRSALAKEGWPRLSIVGDATYANPNPRFFPPVSEFNFTWSVGAVASMSLDAPFMASARGDELEANIASARGQLVGLEALVASQVVSAHLDLLKAHAALAAGETAVRAAEEAYRVTTELFGVGRGTATDLIDAESELLNAKLTIANARIDLAIAALRLDYAVGRDEQVAGPVR